MYVFTGSELHKCITMLTIYSLRKLNEVLIDCSAYFGQYSYGYNLIHILQLNNYNAFVNSGHLNILDRNSIVIKLFFRLEGLEM